MRTICAWCRTELSPGDGTGTSRVSHGICPSCLRELEAALPQPASLRDFLDRLAVPVLLVEDDVVVLTANRAAQDALGKDLAAIRGYRGGDVIECVNARLPGGCGRSVHCAGCTLRNTVQATHRDGQSRYDVTAIQQLASAGGSETRTLLRISTNKVGPIVYLRIDELAVEPEKPG